MGAAEYGVAPLDERARRALQEAEEALSALSGQPVVLVAYQKSGA